MQLSESALGILQNPNRVNILSTANKKGETDVAIFGTPTLTGQSQLSIVLQDSSRSFSFLKENPHASCLVLVPSGKNTMASGVRLYLKVKRIDLTRNPLFLKERQEGGQTGWEKSFNVDLREEAEKRVHPDRHLVLFDIVEVRPVVDHGQGV
jgi:hypothetical protein